MRRWTGTHESPLLPSIHPSIRAKENTASARGWHGERKIKKQRKRRVECSFPRKLQRDKWDCRDRENGRDVEMGASTSKRSKAGSISRLMSLKTNQGKKSSWKFSSKISICLVSDKQRRRAFLPVSLKDAMKTDNVGDPIAIGMCSPRTSDDNRPLQKKGLLPGQQRRQSGKFTGWPIETICWDF